MSYATLNLYIQGSLSCQSFGQLGSIYVQTDRIGCARDVSWFAGLNNPLGFVKGSHSIEFGEGYIF